MLNVIVTKINECKEIEVFERLIDMYDIEKAVELYCENMIDFKGFTGEVDFVGFKHVASKTIRDKNILTNIKFEAGNLEINAYNFENAHITLYFMIVNEDNEKIKLDLEFDTEFDY